MDKDRQLQQDIKQTLDQQSLDGDTQQALRAARMAALDSDSRRMSPAWVPATALSVLGLALIVVYLYTGINQPELPQIAADDLAVITSEDELELLEELEFYVWFDQDENV